MFDHLVALSRSYHHDTVSKTLLIDTLFPIQLNCRFGNVSMPLTNYAHENRRHLTRVSLIHISYVQHANVPDASSRNRADVVINGVAHHTKHT